MKVLSVVDNKVLMEFDSVENLYDIGSDLLELLRDQPKSAFDSARAFEKIIYKLYLALESSDIEG